MNPRIQAIFLQIGLAVPVSACVESGDEIDELDAESGAPDKDREIAEFGSSSSSGSTGPAGQIPGDNPQVTGEATSTSTGAGDNSNGTTGPDSEDVDVSSDSGTETGSVDDSTGVEDGNETGVGTETTGDDPELPPCEEHGQTLGCETESGPGTRYCMNNRWETGWGPCLTEVECTPGEVDSCGFCADPNSSECEAFGEMEQTCVLYGGVPGWNDGCDTPLVLAFDNEPVQFTQAQGFSFDISVRGQCQRSDWPSPRTPWLVMDRNGDRHISDGSELFGSGTRLRAGDFARNGFEALAELDDNGDGRIDARDPGFAQLELWEDGDADRRGPAGELNQLSNRGIIWLELAYQRSFDCDLRGNCEGERARFGYIDGSGRHRQGTIVDVYLPCRD